MWSSNRERAGARRRRGWIVKGAGSHIAAVVLLASPPALTLAAPNSSRAEGAAEAEGRRQRSDVDRPTGVSRVMAGPASGAQSKECEIRGPEVVCARRGLVFSRCAYGQMWRDKQCTGEAGALSRNDVFNPQRRASLGVWRVPTVDELGAPMGFLAKTEDSPFKQGLKYWTSTKAAKDRGYTIMHYGSKRSALGSGKVGTRLSTSDDEPVAVLILVRDGT